MNTVTHDGNLITPSKVVCIGRNYVDHIEELGNEIPTEMVVFIKPNSAISAQLFSFAQEPLHYEAELCFLYHQGRFSAVAIGIDLTKRGLQSKLKANSLPWERAKGFDGSATFSDFVCIDDHQQLALELAINGNTVQAGGVDLMMYKPEQILADLQSFITLEDGDIVMTGTPKGVGLITADDLFQGKVFSGETELLVHTWRAQ